MVIIRMDIIFIYLILFSADERAGLLGNMLDSGGDGKREVVVGGEMVITTTTSWVGLMMRFKSIALFSFQFLFSY